MPVPLLSQILAQPDAVAFLKRVVASRRFANAYLFHGPAGVGKGTAALAFARALLCDRGAGPARLATAEPSLFGDPAPAIPADPGVFDALDDACGACSQCAKAATLQHPDLKFLFPVWGEEKIQSEQITETLQAMRDDPLHVFQYEKAATIRIGLTRELLREMGYRPYEAERRVVVVRDADRMREDQYSAMLKAIEEPGDSTVWVLTTSRASRLPATIRSRTQKVRFAAIAENTVRDLLVSRAGTDAHDAALLAALAGGSIGRALALREKSPRALRDQALALLEPALRRDAPALWKAAQGFMNFGRTGREALRLMVEFHQLWLRDLLRARYGADDEALVNRDRAAEIRRAAEKVDATEIRRRLMVLEEMLRSIEGNVSPDAALFSGLARVAGSRMGEDQWPRHPVDRWAY